MSEDRRRAGAGGSSIGVPSGARSSTFPDDAEGTERIVLGAPSVFWLFSRLGTGVGSWTSWPSGVCSVTFVEEGGTNEGKVPRAACTLVVAWEGSMPRDDSCSCVKRVRRGAPLPPSARGSIDMVAPANTDCNAEDAATTQCHRHWGVLPYSTYSSDYRMYLRYLRYGTVPYTVHGTVAK